MKPLKTQNYYEILGVARQATSAEIRNAYELSRLTFKDDSLATYSLFSDEENQEILVMISKAFQTLFDPQSRTEYDRFLDKVEGDRGSEIRDKWDEARSRGPGNPLVGGTSPRPIPVTLGGEKPGAIASRQKRPPLPGAEELAPEMGVSLDNPVKLGAEPKQSSAPPASEEKTDPPQNSDAVNKFIESITVYNGQVIGKVRRMRGYSLEDVAAHTKIRKTYIQYIEEEEFGHLPAPIYVKGFVNLIASMLGLPPQKVSEEFMAYYRERMP